MTHTYTNTELYNKILQAMDNYKPIFIISNSGAFQEFVSSQWSGTEISFFAGSANVSISPSSEGTVYNPINISASINIGGGAV